MRARVVQTQNLSTFFGGRLTENEMQALSRDALVDSWVAMAAEGIKTLFTIHDEFVNLYPEGEAEDMRKRVDEIMVTAPDWAAGCPLEVESTLSKVYEK